MPKNSCIMQIWAESGKSALPICNYSQILYQFLTFTQNLKRSRSRINTDFFWHSTLFKLDFGNYILYLIKFYIAISCIIILDILCILSRFWTFCKHFTITFLANIYYHYPKLKLRLNFLLY